MAVTVARISGGRIKVPCPEIAATPEFTALPGRGPIQLPTGETTVVPYRLHRILVSLLRESECE